MRRSSTIVERLVPGGLREAAVGLLDERRAQPVGVLVQVLQAGRLRADEAVAEDVLLVAADLDDLAPVERHLEAAGGLAERTGADSAVLVAASTVGEPTPRGLYP